jgi:hypothetical protein
MHLFLPTSLNPYTESTSQLIFKLFLIFSNPENFRKLIFQSALRLSSPEGISAIILIYIFPGGPRDYGPGHQLGRQPKKRSGKDHIKATNKTTTFTIVFASKIIFPVYLSHLEEACVPFPACS